jgi:hypothetical protein
MVKIYFKLVSEASIGFWTILFERFSQIFKNFLLSNIVMDRFKLVSGAFHKFSAVSEDFRFPTSEKSLSLRL